MSQKKKIENSKRIKLVIATVLTLIVILVIVFTAIGRGSKEVASSTQVSTNEAKVSENGDLVIPLSGVTEKASFYDYNVNGTTLQIIAIKAPDGSVRTAFNTCQVCYSSGKGYYVQQGDSLVCQNCGNRFKANQVEVSKGGCNPVPIFSQDKAVDGTNITITKSFLEKSKAIFANWKS